jgi:TetR/AcrR family transcriptional regulator, regulator of cefoperazone and chloramphenicol sensitivity
MSSEETHQKVLHAASVLFAEDGLKRTTTRKIAKKAGVNIATLHYHFGDKQALYKAVISKALMEKEDTWVVLEEAPFEEQLEGWLRSLVFACMGNQHDLLNQIMANEMKEPTEFVHLILEGMVAPKMRLLEGLVRDFLGAGRRDSEITRICFSIVGQILVYHHNRPVVAAMLPEMDYSEKELERLVTDTTEASLGMLQRLQREGNAAN